MRDLHTNHKKPTIKLIIVVLVVLTAVTAGFLGLITRDTDQPQQKTTIVRAGQDVRPATTVRFTAVAGMSVLEQLKDTAEEVVTKESQYGAYVDSIGGLKGGTDNKYWTYYVDGQMANIGAGEYVSGGGEEIIWKFE